MPVLAGGVEPEVSRHQFYNFNIILFVINMHSTFFFHSFFMVLNMIIQLKVYPAACQPPVVDNGWTDFENTIVPAGAVVNVNCYEGFKSYGAATLTCNTYGEFDGSASCVKPDESYGEPPLRISMCYSQLSGSSEVTWFLSSVS